MRIVIEKARRRLILEADDGRNLLDCRISLGGSPLGPKERAGDGKTPEGRYFVCLKKEGKYGPSLGVSYPNAEDARRAGAPDTLIQCILDRAAHSERPPWGTFLGGEIYIHGGGTNGDWTAGCVALNESDARQLYALVPLGTEILLLP